MYGLVEKLKPREYSQLGAINTRSGSTHILKDLSSYGSSIGGASLDGTTGRSLSFSFSLSFSLYLSISFSLPLFNSQEYGL